MPTTKEEALTALAAKVEVEQNLAKLPLSPPLRHAVFAAVLATVVGIPVLPQPMRFVALALIFAGMYLIVQWDKRRLGVFINRNRRGRTRMVTFFMLVLILGLLFASYYFSIFRKEPGVSLALAALAFIIGYLGSTLWQRVFVSELSGR